MEGRKGVLVIILRNHDLIGIDFFYARLFIAQDGLFQGLEREEPGHKSVDPSPMHLELKWSR